MQINSIGSTGSTGFGTTANAPNATKTLGVNDFLKLLSVQMQSQDPLNPMADTEFISQMSSFTSLEQMKTLTQSLEKFIGQQQSVDAQGYLGKNVTMTDPTTGPVTGVVSEISLEGGKPMLVIDGKRFDPSLITAIHFQSPNSVATATSSGPTVPAQP